MSGYTARLQTLGTSILTSLLRCLLSSCSLNLLFCEYNTFASFNRNAAWLKYHTKYKSLYSNLCTFLILSSTSLNLLYLYHLCSIYYSCDIHYFLAVLAHHFINITLFLHWTDMQLNIKYYTKFETLSFNLKAFLIMNRPWAFVSILFLWRLLSFCSCSLSYDHPICCCCLSTSKAFGGTCFLLVTLPNRRNLYISFFHYWWPI